MVVLALHGLGIYLPLLIHGVEVLRTPRTRSYILMTLTISIIMHNQVQYLHQYCN